MSSPLLLYSTNTFIAYAIAERFYRRVHYVWCSPHFDHGVGHGLGYRVAPTSAPMEIYRTLAREVQAGDRHSAKITSNRTGIAEGAAAKRSAGVIDAEQEAEITDILSRAQVQDFRPLLFVIPYAAVAGKVRSVPVANRAHPAVRGVHHSELVS